MEKACSKIRDGEAHADALTKQEREQGWGRRGLAAVRAIPLPVGAAGVSFGAATGAAAAAAAAATAAAAAARTRRWTGATVGSRRARCGRAEGLRGPLTK